MGSFWVDLTRCTLYLLLPHCIVYTLFLVSQGMPQTLQPYVEATTLEGVRQTIAVGPVASQVAIKMLGTNGGGFFNANVAHPFENPTARSNFVQIISIFALGAALTNVFGRMVDDQRQGWAILAAMGVLFLSGVAVTYASEASGNSVLNGFGLTGGNMEGKEVRFGILASALFAVVTTAASCGAVNAMHDSFTALGGLVPMLNMQLGEIIVGGVGAGLYGMLVFVILAIFVAGLMVGRTPEYLGKKIEAKEVKVAMLAILCLPQMMLGLTALATVLPAGLAGPANAGPHGFSEILYRWTRPDHGPVSPAEMIPIAESTGFVIAIGRWALRKACAEALSWPAHMRVAVNISSSHFRLCSFSKEVEAVLDETGLQPECLEIAITESIFLANTPHVLDNLRALRSLGVRIALDDFGTGYSSLSYLTQFPVDKIKIDRAFVRDLSSRPECLAVIKAIMVIARPRQRRHGGRGRDGAAGDASAGETLQLRLGLPVQSGPAVP